VYAGNPGTKANDTGNPGTKATPVPWRTCTRLKYFGQIIIGGDVVAKAEAEELEHGDHAVRYDDEREMEPQKATP